MPENHVHEFYGGTTFFDGHSHRYSGYTSTAYDMGYNHVHRIVIVISIEIDHDHEIEVITGPEIYTERGHVHRFIGTTSRKGRPPHTHYFEEVTTPPIAYYYSV